MPDIAYGIRMTADAGPLKQGAGEGAAALDRAGASARKAADDLKQLSGAQAQTGAEPRYDRTE